MILFEKISREFNLKDIYIFERNYLSFLYEALALEDLVYTKIKILNKHYQSDLKKNENNLTIKSKFKVNHNLQINLLQIVKYVIWAFNYLRFFFYRDFMKNRHYFMYVYCDENHFLK